MRRKTPAFCVLGESMRTSLLGKICYLPSLWMVVFALIGAGCSSSLFKGLGKKREAEPTSTAKALNEPESGEWLTSYEQAKEISLATGKPILADFTGSDWCHWCKKLDKEVFDKREFKAWAAENVVLLELDTPRYGSQPEIIQRQNERLAKQFQVSSYPTVLLIGGDEQVLGKLGYVKGGPGEWIAQAESQLVR